MTSDHADIFDRAGCSGQALVRDLQDDREVGLRPDEPVVLASTVKVLVALEVQQAFEDGRLDPAVTVTVTPELRVPGPVGLSMFTDDPTLSLRDLVVLSLTISDNTATDLLLEAVGLEAVNRRARDLALQSTVVRSGIAGLLDSIATDLGYPTWAVLRAAADELPSDEAAALDAALPRTTALTPTAATRSTPRDMAALLQRLWQGTAASPAACERVRQLMGRQLTRHRLAAGFPPEVTVAAKSGGLLGVVRNEVGVITYPDGSAYAAAVFTRTAPGADGRPVDAAIGAWACAAVEQLRSAR